MSGTNVFDNDLFTLTSMTAAINHQPATPNRVRNLGIFEEQGIATTTAWIERKAGKLQLVANQERGTPGQSLAREKRDALPFKCMHLPQNDFIMADEVQNVRDFGSESNLKTIESVRDEKLERMRANLDATEEFHRVGALQGKIYDADGTTVVEDLYDRFGLTKTTTAFGLTSDGNGENDFRNKSRTIQRNVKKVLGGNVVVRGWIALCGIGFYDKLVAHEAMKRAWDRFNDSEMLRTDQSKPFSYAGVGWEEYDGMIGDDYLIPEERAILIPLVSGLCLTRYAPAPWFDTVNTRGLPYYSRPGKESDESLELKAQSNPMHLCTMPNAIIELKP